MYIHIYIYIYTSLSLSIYIYIYIYIYIRRAAFFCCAIPVSPHNSQGDPLVTAVLASSSGEHVYMGVRQNPPTPLCRKALRCNRTCYTH